MLSFCLLSCCGSSGNQKIKYTEAWGSRLSHLLDDLHGILGHFDSEDGFSTGEVEWEECSFHQVDSTCSLPICSRVILTILRDFSRE